jgi:hypothetical protein
VHAGKYSERRYRGRPRRRGYLRRPFLACPWSAGLAPTRPRPGPRRQPVAEVLAEHSLKQLDVVLEPWQQRLSLLPAKRLAFPATALQKPLKLARRRGRPAAREQLAEPVVRPDGSRDGAVGQRLLRVRGDVFPGDFGDHPGMDSEEGTDPPQRGGRLVDEPPVADHQQLLAREQRERVVKLRAIFAERGVVAEAGPPGGDPALFLGARLDEVADRLKPGRPQVRPVGVRPLDRIPQDHDELRRRDEVPDAPQRRPVVEVQRRRFAAQRTGRGRLEQCLVPVPLPDVLPVGERVPGAAAGRRRAVGEEELRFLDRRHEQARMPGQRRVQGCRPRLRNPGHQEVGQCHVPPRSAGQAIHYIFDNISG